MIVESIELKNYRSYEELHIDLSPGTNILYGDNAQGKTNVLESIYLCCTSKSHRGSKDRDIIRFSQEESHIKLQIRRGNVPCRIDMHLKKNKPKGIAINGIPLRRASELFGVANVVYFSPEDLNLIKNGPSERRRFIDMELCQLSQVYVHSLVQYNRALMQRNKLLKELSFHPEYEDTLDIWDEQLIRYGREVMEQRRSFLAQMDAIVHEIHGNLSGGREDMKLIYAPDTREEDLEQAFKKNRPQDIKQKTTLSGPHRDDMNLMIGGVDVRRFGSQGQQRTAALSLKLSELELMQRISRDNPVLLLDDVLSELDGHRQNQLLSAIRHIQTIITCTGLDEFVNNRFPIDRIFKAAEHTVKCENE